MKWQLNTHRVGPIWERVLRNLREFKGSTVARIGGGLVALVFSVDLIFGGWPKGVGRVFKLVLDAAALLFLIAGFILYIRNEDPGPGH